MILVMILVCSICLLAYKWCINSRFIQRSMNLSKYPSPGLWWLFGVDTLYQDLSDLRNHNSSRRSYLRHQALGPTYVSTLFGVPTIHTIDPRNILTVTTHEFENFGKGPWTEIISQYMGKGILVNDGEAWSVSRAALKPLFKRNKDQDITMFDLHVTPLISRLQQYGKNIIDFQKETQITVLNITIHMLWGGRPDEASQGARKGLLKLIDDLEPYGNLVIEMGPLAIPELAWNYRHITRLVRGISEFFYSAVQDTLRKSGQTANLESPPLTIIQQMLSRGMTPEQSQGELQNIFFAAFDTTTALLTNLFDCIGRDRTIQQRIKDELARVVAVDGTMTETCISKAVYLRATVLETLRLHSPVTSHIRRARINTFLPHGALDGNGRTPVPRGTSVIWSTYALNRQSLIYGEDCMDFRPERWLDRSDQGVLLGKSDYMPFGSGPRNCLGQQFALLLVSYVAARILMAVDWIELHEPELEFQEAAAVTYYNGRGTRIRFHTNQTV